MFSLGCGWGAKMTNFSIRTFLISTVTSASLFCSSVAIVAFVLTPDTAFAKSENGKGNGKGKGKGGGGSNASKASEASQFKPKSQKTQYGKRIKLKNNGARSSKTGSGKLQKTSLSDFGREFKRDVQELFGIKQSTKPRRNAVTTPKKATKKASIKPLEKSLRPVTRSSKHYYRDPLVAKITDPYGSDKLRNLNASNAAYPALRNAAPNSNVGKIATYQAAAYEYYDLRSDLYDARRDLRELNESYDGRSSDEIADDIADLDPSDPNYDDDLRDLEKELQDAEAYEEARDNLHENIAGIKSETKEALYQAESAFFDASKGQTLTPDALGDFHSNLGLPQPKAPYQDDVTIQPVGYDPSYHHDAQARKYQPTETDYRLRYENAEYSGKHRGKRYYGDPLVAAITDPYGSDKLRNLNASNAAAPALRNAAPNSNVGKIATYQSAANEYYDLRSDLYDARHDLRDLNESYDGRSSDEIADDIADLDPSDPNYDDDLRDLEKELQDAEAYEEARDDLRADVKGLRVDTMVAQKEAEHAFFEASKDTELTKDALADFHENLDLPEPGDHYDDEVTTQPISYNPDYHHYSNAHAYMTEVTDYQLDFDGASGGTEEPLSNNYSVPLASETKTTEETFKLRDHPPAHALEPRYAFSKDEVAVIAAYRTAVVDYDEPRPNPDVASREVSILKGSEYSSVSADIIREITELDPSDPEFYNKLDVLGSELRKADTND